MYCDPICSLFPHIKHRQHVHFFLPASPGSEAVTLTDHQRGKWFLRAGCLHPTAYLNIKLCTELKLITVKLNTAPPLPAPPPLLLGLEIHQVLTVWLLTAQSGKYEQERCVVLLMNCDKSHRVPTFSPVSAHETHFSVQLKMFLRDWQATNGRALHFITDLCTQQQQWFDI